ncbi:hypothetical protein BH09BAC5_BH09BAC5_29850 [soil metagenome]
MQKITPTLGWIGFTLGIIVMIASLLPGYAPYVAVFAMLPGFLLSSIYVLFSTKYQLKSKYINPGFMGMILNSTPLVMFVYFQMSK